MNCNNCEDSNSNPFITSAKCYWSKTPLTVVECNTCGLVFLNPRPDKSLGIEYFDKAYSNAEGFEDHSYYTDNAQILTGINQGLTFWKNFI
ncbi:MAG: hypothetical protein IPN29_00170 [Saprospiraceae bacterium]|nr:hypothetical protein [Saprospiraceae bacterium]